MKKKIIYAVIFIMFLTGLSLLLYPLLSDQWNTYRQNQLISGYETRVSDLTEKDFTEEWKKARDFNAGLSRNHLYADVFGEDGPDMRKTEYWNVLNVGGDGVMGYLSIPKIDIRLAIYHGTGDDILQTGVGHMNGSALPVGGKGTHSILAAHRGLPGARLFTDVDQLKCGDLFYIHIFDQVFAYQVDEIFDMIEKDDRKTLEQVLQVQPGKDLVTLFTCTPYGVNSHRLLIRGARIPYHGEEETADSLADTMLQSIQNYYVLYLILGLAITLLMILFMKFLIMRRKK